MDRRRFIRLGLGSGAVVVSGVGLYLWAQPEPGGPDLIWRRVADAVLDGVLPTEASRRDRALDEHLVRLGVAVGGLSGPTQLELEDLLKILATAPGRLGLMGLTVPWALASREQVQAGLNTLRFSGLEIKQQAFHALRDLTNATYFTAQTNWDVLGYPGPTEL